MLFVSFDRFIQRMFGFGQQPLVDFAADECEAEQKTETRDDVAEATPTRRPWLPRNLAAC
jgi:hypothetical protein